MTTAVARTEKMYRGRTALDGTKTWKLIPKEYIVGAMFAVTLRLSSTVRNLPNPPVGWRMAAIRSPTDPDAYASDQEGTKDEATPKAAPRL